jgi:uncharacterized membrane protein
VLAAYTILIGVIAGLKTSLANAVLHCGVFQEISDG